MREIQLTQGKVALVDDNDFDFVMQWKWCAWRMRNNWYAICAANRISMHCLLCDAGKQNVDHKNGNGLDNQRHNLRPATFAESAQNRGVRSDNACGFKGVYWRFHVAKWNASITACGVRRHLGDFRRLIDAAVAYDEAAQRYFGEFARLNFLYDPACYI